MEEIRKAVDKWMKKNKGDVAFVGSFISFDKKGDVADNMLVGFGDKGTLKISIDGIKDEFKKEKDDFISW